MADKTQIEWTDATWNVITGCSVISPGCTNCYAMKLAGTRLKNHPTRAGLTIDTKAGPVWNGQVRFNDSMLTEPLRWKRPRNIFVCAHGDLFHEAVPDEWIDRVFAVMALAPQHTFQVLTKRPLRMANYLHNGWTPARIASDGLAEVTLGYTAKTAMIFNGQWPLPNVLLGVSVEDQTRADERRDHLGPLARQGWRTFVSYEPALGPVDWTGWEFLKWMISGGESQTGARPSHPDWHRAARDFCAANGIPYLFKQVGDWGWPTTEQHHADYCAACNNEGPWPFDKLLDRDGKLLTGDAWQIGSRVYVRRVGKRAAGRLLDGVEHNGMPEATP